MGHWTFISEIVEIQPEFGNKVHNYLLDIMDTGIIISWKSQGPRDNVVPVEFINTAQLQSGNIKIYQSNNFLLIKNSY